MNLRNRIQQRTRRVSMTPLIDVVFILLMFFMLSSTFTRETTLPIAAAAASDHPSPRGADAQLIRLRANGRMELAGQIIDGPDDLLRSLQHDLGATEQVMLVPDDDVSVQLIITVLERIANSGLAVPLGVPSR
ncbi:MAG: biopolymer transporter ExbD [Gammaproteobacteria bacterium]|nr:biopolymer transporter ExbD [Gammaproteobacteria bacterium]